MTLSRDALLRILHTFWQAFVAALAVTWAAAGIDVTQVVDLASAKKIALSALMAIAAAALSAVKSMLANALPGAVADTGPGAIEDDVAGKHEAPAT